MGDIRKSVVLSIKIDTNCSNIPIFWFTLVIVEVIQIEDFDQPDITGLKDKIVKVGLEAGDLLIFNSQLAHGIRPNLSKNKVRIAQYISMMPAQEENQTLLDWRINSWKNRIAPEGYAFPGDPRNWEKEKYQTAILSDLGKSYWVFRDGNIKPNKSIPVTLP